MLNKRLLISVFFSIFLIGSVGAYLPPNYNNINLVLKSSYTPPSYNNINLVLGTTSVVSTCWSYDSSTKTLYVPNGCIYYVPNGQVGYI